MARHTVLTDDLDGSPADHTVKFSIDGTHYEMDLSEANRTLLDVALEPFVTAARVTRTTRPKVVEEESIEIVNQVDYPGKPKPQPTSAELRRWARENGFSVGNTGRISLEILEAYQNAS